MTDEYGGFKLPTAKTDKLTGLPLRYARRIEIHRFNIDINGILSISVH